MVTCPKLQYEIHFAILNLSRPQRTRVTPFHNLCFKKNFLNIRKFAITFFTLEAFHMRTCGNKRICGYRLLT